MSHEGIRFISAEEAKQAAGEEQKMPVDAVTPKRVRVDKSGGTGMEIDWKDGHQSAWNFAWMRNACPCATCHEERLATGRAVGAAKEKPKTLLVMYEAPVRPAETTPVGRYAIRFKWTDGHESGIYSWEYLRRVCQCAECLARAAGAAKS